MIGSTGMIPTPKERYVTRKDLYVCHSTLTCLYRSWQSNCDKDALRETDPGLAIASSVPIHRLGAPAEVANVVVM